MVHQCCMWYLVRTMRQAGGSAVSWQMFADDCRQRPSAVLSVSVTQALTPQHPSHHCSPMTSTPHVTTNSCLLSTISEEGNAISSVRLFHSIFEHFTSISCMCMGHDHSSPGIKIQSQRSRHGRCDQSISLSAAKWNSCILRSILKPKNHLLMSITNSSKSAGKMQVCSTWDPKINFHSGQLYVHCERGTVIYSHGHGLYIFIAVRPDRLSLQPRSFVLCGATRKAVAGMLTCSTALRPICLQPL